MLGDITLGIFGTIVMVNDTTPSFGLDSDRFIEMIDQLALAKAKTCYSFMAEDEFAQICRTNLKVGAKLYWNELLARAHLTAMVAILRSRHWIRAIVTAKRDKNLLSFAAAFRGFIESAADASSALGSIPGTFSRDHAQIIRALSGKLEDQFVISKEMEDELIHFSHARHITKAERSSVPPSHEAKKVRDYIEVLENGKVDQVINCYQSLCDLTHPGASSVWMWLTTENGVDVDLTTTQDDAVIEFYLAEYRETFLQLLMFAFNPALVTLNVLNYCPIKTLHTPGLLELNLSGIPLWQKCQKELGGASPYANVRLRVVK